MTIGRIITVLLLGIAIGGCKKETGNQKTYDERLEKPYCNDPDAINYNWDFPGRPDNSTCFYADEVFKGTYELTDSLLNADFIPDTPSKATFLITISAIDKKHLRMSGYAMNSICTLTSLALTADRYYKATIDSFFVPPPDSAYLPGMPVCSTDTLSGYISINPKGDTLKLVFSVQGDTGLYYHQAIGIKK